MEYTFSKYFSLEEANKSLALVKKIVHDLLNVNRRISAEIEKHGREAVSGNAVIQNLISEAEGYINELEEIGVLYKGINQYMALVDFPAIIDGETVFLCWKSDEPALKYYHKIEAGFAGRKEIPDIS